VSIEGAIDHGDVPVVAKRLSAQTRLSQNATGTGTGEWLMTTDTPKRDVFCKSAFRHSLAHNVLFLPATGNVTARTLSVVLVAGAPFN